MMKSLPNKLHLKQYLYSHVWLKVRLSLIIFPSLRKFLLTLTMEIKYDDEDLGLILLCYLPPLYMNFRDIILYSTTLTLEEAYEALCSTETIKQLVDQPEDIMKETN